MWKVVVRFYNGGRKTLKSFESWWDADEFMRNPGDEYEKMPCGVWRIEKVREAK